MAKKVRDLRSALELLAELPGQLLETDVEVEPMAQLSGVYRYVGAGGTVKRPTKEGPAMIFHNVKGHPDASVAIGVLASRKRVAALLDCKPEELGKMLCRSVEKPVLPVMCQGEPVCQQVVHRADEPDFDLYKLVPAPTNTPYDAGPYITLGMCYAAHPDTGAHDVTIHRLCIQGRDELSIFFTPGARHIGAMAERAEQLGRRLPISISIGVDPAIEIGSCFEPPTTPLGYDELSVAGALRGEPVKLCRCLTVDELAIANAEYVIEGEVVPNVRVKEDQNTHTGFAMPEFPGYTGPASDQCWSKRSPTGCIPLCRPASGPARNTCPWLESPQRPAYTVWWKKPCRAGFRMYTAVLPEAENTWRCFSLRSLLPVMKAGRDRQPFWPFPLSVN